MSLDALFANPLALPVMPRVVQELIRSFSREDVAVSEIARQLTADPVLGAKTLRLANSAYFHAVRPVATVDDAVKMLGFVMLRNLVVGCGVVGAFPKVPGIDMPQFWRYSLHSASVARWLAQQGGHDADLAFTVGLLHGLGQLVMHVAQPEPARRLDARCHPLHAERAALEHAEFGYHYGEVSAALAERWHFPYEISVPLRCVPAPLAADPVRPLPALVHVAVWRARLAELGPATDFPAAVAAAAGLGWRWQPEAATLVAVPGAGLPPLPPLDELEQGLGAMFG